MNAALRTQRALTLWALLGLLSFALLPWYFLQQGSLWSALPHIAGGPETASALLQALQHEHQHLRRLLLEVYSKKIAKLNRNHR